MPRVIPSAVVTFIRRSFPSLESDPAGRGLTLESGHVGVVAPLVALVDDIPRELLALITPVDHEEYLAAIALLKTALNNWSFGTHSAWQAKVQEIRAYSKHPVAIIRDVLSKCPDVAPAQTTTDFAFLRDPQFAADLKLDLSHAFSELGNREYKSATVLAGSIVESLLLWAVAQKAPAQLTSAIAASSKKHLKPDLKGWGLDDLLVITQQLNLISPQTVKATEAAKDFRNLIHPERSQRLGQACSQATGMSAYAAALHVIEDLEKWDSRGRP